MPIYYWPPLIFVLLAPLLLADRVPLTLQLILPLILILPLSAYAGSQSDWETYRQFVLACDQPGCTYFEPGFDRLVYIASETIGFSLIEIVLWLCIVISFSCLKRIFPDINPVVLLISLYSAYFALYLGAIRQSISSVFFLIGLTFYMRSYKSVGSAIALSGGIFHIGGIISASFLWAISLAGRLRTYGMIKRVLGVMIVTAAAYAVFDYLSDSLPRLGETNIGTSYVVAGALGVKDLLIALERFVFLIMASNIMTKRGDQESVLLFAFEASAFIIFYSLAVIDRNIAGRTIAFLRVADVIVLWLGLRFGVLPKAIIILSYVTAKQYYTIVSVGFFDD